MMNRRSRNHEDVYQNMLLDLNQIGKEERELELRLGPPGDEQDWSQGHNENTYKRERDDSSSLCFGYFSSHIVHHQQHNNQNKAKGKDSSPFLELQSSKQNMTVLGKESKDATQPSSCPKVDEKKPFSPAFANTNIPNSSQKRTNAPGPVVGWPPIHSSRKNNNNIASLSSSKHKYHGPHQHHLHLFPNKSANNDKEHVQNNVTEKGLFVKINMDGVPIGRKVDINACGSYQKLSHVVDDLFRDLLAAQRDSCGGGVQRRREEQEKVITGLLDQGNDEYTLAFEDHEGHNMLVRDVPWMMFVSTVKRLRVLKSSDLSAFSLGSKQIHTNK